MKLRYNAGFGVLLIVASAFMLLTSLLIGFSVNTITGAILLLVGIAYMTRPLGELRDDRLTVLALIGPVRKEYPVAGLRLVDEKLFSGEKKVPIARWLVNSEDWRALKQRIGAG